MNENARLLKEKLIRNFNTVSLKHFLRSPAYDTQTARLAHGTVAKKLGASVDVLAPGKVSCPYHFHHAQEEMFVILEGSGTLRVAGEMLSISTGDVLFIPNGPTYPHQIVNSSDTPLKYLSISTRETPEICEYPDSGKYSAMVVDANGAGFNAIQRPNATLDYWDGEP